MGINLNRWTRLIKLLCIMIVLSTILTGCWDRLEIEDRAVVLGVSIDVAKPEAEGSEGEITHLAGSLPAPATGRVRVGVQIALPGRIPLGPGESGGGGKGGGSQTVWVIDVKGYSIDDAFMNYSSRSPANCFSVICA